MVFAFTKFKCNEYYSNRFLRLYGGHSLAYHSLQSGLSHFVTEFGYIAYIEFQNETIVLGDPVADCSQYKTIIEQFLKCHPFSSFIQVSKEVSKILAQCKFSVTYFGVESEISLPYTLNGKEKKEIRLLSNAAKRNQIEVREIFDRSEIFNFKSCTYTAKEYAFLSRPFISQDENDVRIFGGFHNRKLVGYSLFDPMYHNDTIIGYAEVISRQSHKSPKGSRTFILLEAMTQFSKENKMTLNLGLLPFYPKEKKLIDKNQKYNKIIELIFSSLYYVSPLVSNFAGLSFHKSRYRGKLLPKYFATNSKKPYKSLLCIYKLTTGNWLPRLKKH